MKGKNFEKYADGTIIKNDSNIAKMTIWKYCKTFYTKQFLMESFTRLVSIMIDEIKDFVVYFFCEFSLPLLSYICSFIFFPLIPFIYAYKDIKRAKQNEKNS